MPLSARIDDFLSRWRKYLHGSDVTDVTDVASGGVSSDASDVDSDVDTDSYDRYYGCTLFAQVRTGQPLSADR